MLLEVGFILIKFNPYKVYISFCVLSRSTLLHENLAVSRSSKGTAK